VRLHLRIELRLILWGWWRMRRMRGKLNHE
jgi:hypothetical protein